jgi:hypothetical protein
MLRSMMLRSMTPNADYFTPLSRAVASIDRDSYAARFAVYDREHKALLRRLATADSPCSDADVAREEQAFRDAIRRIECADEFAEEGEQPTLVPQDEPVEEAPPEPRRAAAWAEVRAAEVGPVEVNPADLRPADLRPMAGETFDEPDLAEPPEPGFAIEPRHQHPVLQLTEPRSVARRVGERLALAVVILALAGAGAWMGAGRQDESSSTSLRGAVEPAEPTAPDNLTDAKSAQPTWLSPEIFYAPPPLPSSSPAAGPALASAPRPEVPLPVPRPDR